MRTIIRTGAEVNHPRDEVRARSLSPSKYVILCGYVPAFLSLPYPRVALTKAFHVRAHGELRQIHPNDR